MPKQVVESGAAKTSNKPDGKLDSPSYHRNHTPIEQVLVPLLEGHTGHVLEIGSGTGQHIVELARALPQLAWWPSDIKAKHIQSIKAWSSEANLKNLHPPMQIDARLPDWGTEGKDHPLVKGLTAILSINVLHVAPWEAAKGLIQGAGKWLNASGYLILYGPFKRGGSHTAESNAQFDAELRARYADWGVRDITELETLANEQGLTLSQVVPMPANNFTLIFQK